MHNAFFVSAILFNLFNWAHLVIDIKQYHEWVELGPNVRCMKISNVVLQILNIGIFLGIAIFSCEESRVSNYQLIDKITRAINSAIFLLIAIAFLYAGLKLYQRLRQVAKEEAKLMKYRIVISIILIFIPLLVRSIFNLIFYIIFDLRGPLITDSLENNDYVFPLFFVFYYGLTSLFPIGAQYLSVRIVLMHYNTSVNNRSFLTDKEGSSSLTLPYKSGALITRSPNGELMSEGSDISGSGKFG